MRRTIGWLMLVLGAWPWPMGAELVIFGGGDVLKVTGYEVGSEKTRLTLPSGGILTVSTLRIERILDDEISDEPPAPAVPPPLSLAYRDGQVAPETPYRDLILDAARRHGVNPEVVAAVVRVESAFDPRAVSPKGARGLMQLMPATADRFGASAGELFDPAVNIEAGTRYLRWLLERFGEDPRRVLAAYNAGEGSVDRYDGVPPYRETQRYVRKLLELLGES